MTGRVADCVIVGAGITGAAVAAHLARDGVSTVVLEAGDHLGRGATGSSGGMVRAFDPDPAIAGLALDSLLRYADPQAWASGSAPLHKVGAVTLAAPEHADEFKHAADTLRAAGWPAEFVADATEVLGVRTAGAVALVEPDAGWVDPVRVTADLLDQATAAAATIHFGTQVTALTPNADGAVDVITNAGTFRATRNVILAVGAWITAPEFADTEPAHVRTRSIQTALVRRPPGPTNHATFIDLRTGGYGKPIDDQTSLIGYPLLEWDVDPAATPPPDAAHQQHTAEVVAANLPWLRNATTVGAIRSADAYAHTHDTHTTAESGGIKALTATRLSGVWLCRPGSGGGVRVAPELGRRAAAFAGASEGVMSEP